MDATTLAKGNGKKDQRHKPEGDRDMPVGGLWPDAQSDDD